MKRLYVYLIAAVVVSSVLCLSGYCSEKMADAPVSHALNIIASRAPLIKSVETGGIIDFVAEDFERALGVKTVDGITVASLPSKSSGELLLGKLRVMEGQRIPRTSLKDLRFKPDRDVFETSFTFKADGCDYEIGCVMYVLDKDNYAPTSLGTDESFYSFTTFKNISYSSNMVARDPEGDELTYEVVSYPKKGLLTVIDRATGDYTYTPIKNYIGSDSFSYVACDKYGNRSVAVTVDIEVKNSDSGRVFADMINDPAHYSALLLCDMGVMEASKNESGDAFMPELTVTKGDFLVCAMKALSVAPDENAPSDGSIPSEYRNYMSVASRLGAITLDGENAFEYQSKITKAEACVILAALLDTDPLAYVPVFFDSDDIPYAAHNAVCAMVEMNILSLDRGYVFPDRELTRGQMARMIAAAVSRNEN